MALRTPPKLHTVGDVPMYDVQGPDGGHSHRDCKVKSCPSEGHDNSEAGAVRGTPPQSAVGLHQKTTKHPS